MQRNFRWQRGFARGRGEEYAAQSHKSESQGSKLVAKDVPATHGQNQSERLRARFSTTSSRCWIACPTEQMVPWAESVTLAVKVVATLMAISGSCMKFGSICPSPLPTRSRRLDDWSGKEVVLRPPPPLRTGRETFASSGSSQCKAPRERSRFHDGLIPAC